jgi:hypothetical protein
MIKPVAPSQARWYVFAVIGRDIDGGTETSEISNYYGSDRRPTRADIRPEGWQVLEFTTRAVNR